MNKTSLVLDINSYAKTPEAVRVEPIPNTDKLRVSLNTGITLEGTEPQLVVLLQHMGYTIPSLHTYKSSSSGSALLISQMASRHIRNALSKLCREYFNNFNGTNLTNTTLVSEIEDFSSRNGEIKWLVEELKRRGDD